MSVIDRQRFSPEQPITRKVLKLMDTALQVIKLALFKGEAQHEASLMIA
jgi:hypothetical protein